MIERSATVKINALDEQAITYKDYLMELPVEG